MGSVYYGLGEWERELSLPPLMFLGMEVVVWWDPLLREISALIN
jgi:hypothetical protein